MRIPKHAGPALATALLFLGAPGATLAQEVLGEPAAAEQVTLEGVSHEGHRVTGTVVNRTGNEVRGVKLLVRYDFQWNDEFHPGEASPGHAAVVPLEESLPASGRAGFAYAPPEPLPERDDGYFVPRVEVLGFTEVLPPDAAGR